MNRTYSPFPLLFLVAGAALLAQRPAVTAPVPLRIEPPTARCRLGDGFQFRARLGSRDATVTWRVEGAGNGTITSSGYYQAPPSGSTPASLRVIASLDAGDAGGRAEGVVQLLPVMLAVTPEEAELPVGESAQFRAKVEGAGDLRVAWSVDGGAANGAVSESGFFTAPARFTTPGTIMVRATSKADPTKSSTATLRVRPVELRADTKVVPVKHGIGQRLVAEVKGAPNAAVEWSLQEGSQGRISPNGLYKTPESMATPADVLVIVRAAADPTKMATLRLRVEPIQVNIGVAAARGEKRRGNRRPGVVGRIANEAYRTTVPSVVRLIIPFEPGDMFVKGPTFRGKSGKQYAPLGGTVAFDATVLNTTDDRVNWEIVGNPIGEISGDGIYRIPEKLATPQVVQIRATSLADPTKAVVQTINIPPVLVQAQRTDYLCPLGSAVQLAAVVENSENRKLTWLVEGGERFGTVSAEGLYRPPNSLTTPATVLVKATSVADPSKSLTLRVAVPALGLELSPERAEVRAGRLVRLKVSIPGGKGTPSEVTWRLSPQVGEITPDGTYHAPEGVMPQTVQVTATLAADPSKTATATVKITGR